MLETQHQAARAKITIPISWGSERKVAYIGLEKDLPEFAPTGESFDLALAELKATADRFKQNYQPEQTTTTRQPKQIYCRICESNGFPNQQIKWPAIFKLGNLPLNMDGTSHVHKAK